MTINQTPSRKVAATTRSIINSSWSPLLILLMMVLLLNAIQGAEHL